MFFEIFRLPKRNLLELFYPFFILFKLMNVLYLTPQDNDFSGDQIMQGFYDKIFKLLHLILNFYIISQTLKSDNINLTKIKVIDIGNFCFNIFVVTTIAAYNLTSFYFYKLLNKILKMMIEFDRRVNMIINYL